MPTANFGENITFSTSKFTKLKSKGDKIQFRIIKAPFYDGKHFLKDENGNWDIHSCPRINERQDCPYCENFFKALKKAKKDELDKKEADKLTNPWKASISYYYPVINRETGNFEVFQTTSGVRNQIETEISLNAKTLKRDLVVLRTEVPGNYYSLSIVDSSESKPLTEDEEAKFKIGKETNLSDYICGTEDEDSNVAFEDNSVDLEDNKEVEEAFDL